jgi:hypothetical protein
VFTHPVNLGVCAAKNTGFDNIRGEWFTTLDSDDEMTPDALAAMLECATRTGATAVTCNCVDGVTGQLTGSGPTCDGWLSAEDADRCRGEHWGITRTELLGDSRLDPRLPGFEHSLWLRINARAPLLPASSVARVSHGGRGPGHASPTHVEPGPESRHLRHPRRGPRLSPTSQTVGPRGLPTSHVARSCRACAPPCAQAALTLGRGARAGCSARSGVPAFP